MAEKNILAYFKSPEQAKQALEQIKSLKLVDSSIDRFDGYPGDGSDHIDNPITSDFPGLGYLTLGGDFSDRDAGILAATSVSASGMSSGGQDNEVTGRDILLTVVIEEEDFEQAMAIVQKAGALV
ncbi:hypothetical protein [Paenibacillus harenae]|uniref:General stress protein 17M-like domain-containing protein n=1 Tax=Paenibacillus harenae TaxID=306543 RepID=A0ABT9UA27_PAEHA|nr:hypothetical protein [Paenibacillus harenae]MDQ0063843.1 hypothetical protein [Paenibacillus harenae]MDQ0116112.1 hypothetical protein [Paenibacillus harenae]